LHRRFRVHCEAVDGASSAGSPRARRTQGEAASLGGLGVRWGIADDPAIFPRQ
jgi:hypothetical protein